MKKHVGPIEEFMTADHARLDRLLAASERDDGRIDQVTYARFRHDLLRHIGMEEKVLLPFARARRSGNPLPLARALRSDHSEIVKLLVRSPSQDGMRRLRELLGGHNALEEGSGGLYAQCDALAEDDGDIVVERLIAQPSVPVAPYYDGPFHARRPKAAAR